MVLRPNFVVALTLTGTFLLGAGASAQELRDYYVTCDPGDFEYLLTHPQENTPIVCDFEYQSQIWEGLNLSLREGVYSTFPKKSFKLDFAEEEPFAGRDVANLMAQYNDPTFSRQYLTHDLFQRAGLPVSGTWFTRLYVNDVYIGLYLDVEEVDSTFLLVSGLAENSSIYKADTIGCLLTPSEPVEELWEKVTNSATGYYDLENLIIWIETTPGEIFFDELSERFDADELARVIAVNALIGNQATYYDNYILLHNINQYGKWRLLPWDADSTFVYWSDYDQPDYFRSGHELLSQTNPLINRCWRDSSMRALIFEHMEGLMDSLFTESYYQDITDELASLLYDAVLQDTLKQYSIDDFSTYLAQIPGHVANRSANLSDQMQYEPLPFDLYPAILTPTGIYFSWHRSFIQDGSPVAYSVQIADDPQFTINVTNLDITSSTSLLYNQIQPGQYYWRVFAYSPSGDDIRSITYFSPFTIPENAFSGTVVTGEITTSTTWDLAGSPYSLPEGLTIAPGAVLTIEPGVLIGIGADHSITIEGGLTAIGTAEDSIHFVPMNPDSNWGAILIDHASDAIAMNYASITRGSNDPSGPIPDAGSMIQVSTSNFNMYDSHMSYGTIGAVAAWMSSIHFERVYFDHCQWMIGVHFGKTVLRSCRFSHGSTTDEKDLVDIEWATDSSEVSYCMFYGCDSDDFDIDAVQNLIFKQNVVVNAADKGISIGASCSNINLINNIFSECTIGIGIKTSCSALLYNNLVLRNNEGLKLINDSEIGETYAYNTVFYQNTFNVVPSHIGILSVEYSLIGDDDPYPGTGNINSDPQFIDLWNGNFYPLPNSPLIDAGYGTGAPEFDFLDSARYDDPNTPNTGAGEIDYVDIGVYEYYPNAVPVVGAPQPMPDGYELLENFPNPFNSVTKINFYLQQTGWAEIAIYDILGRRVFHRRFEQLLPGQHSLLWSGRNDRNSYVASGIYFCQMDTKLGSQTIKMVLLK